MSDDPVRRYWCVAGHAHFAAEKSGEHFLTGKPRISKSHDPDGQVCLTEQFFGMIQTDAREFLFEAFGR